MVACTKVCVCEKDYEHMQQGLLYFKSPFEMIVAD